MEISLNAILFKSPENIERFVIKVDQTNYELVRKKLQSEKGKIVCYINHLKSMGLIKSTLKPRNKNIQDQLDDMVSAKKVINKSINSIKTIFN